MNPASLAGSLLAVLAPDTLYTPQQVRHRLALAGLPDADAYLLPALHAGWLTAESTGEVGYADRCWLPVRRAVAVPVDLPQHLAPQFSYFRGPITNKTPCQDVTPAQLWQVLTGEELRQATAALRALPPGPERDALKRGLDYVTPAGTFQPTRLAAHLAQPSGLLVLDFDHVPDVAAARAALLADALLGPAVVLLFTSPSGDGLKCLLTLDARRSYLDNFRAVATYLASRYAPLGLVPDASGKDIARACFLCHDPDAYLHPRFAA
ncbi:BT4734/BF3469 family protein [Hymenobacter guriensis]|uniref:BT4734-like N-terminal domain-containing protein n=1 Tax=Hymenobacter guriensis TaxID=2793065 RepID=A0ABS0KXJ4_9BACT|nr:BT4734/BF3469 family protein [Hymenobacter guriensis]MBG8552577.1 hypothetical protein [Hymenobacter guriensis]